MFIFVHLKNRILGMSFQILGNIIISLLVGMKNDTHL